jgi:hypothetical protein
VIKTEPQGGAESLLLNVLGLNWHRSEVNADYNGQLVLDAVFEEVGSLIWADSPEQHGWIPKCRIIEDDSILKANTIIEWPNERAARLALLAAVAFFHLARNKGRVELKASRLRTQDVWDYIRVSPTKETAWLVEIEQLIGGLWIVRRTDSSGRLNVSFVDWPFAALDAAAQVIRLLDRYDGTAIDLGQLQRAREALDRLP